jgi:hypothetical protein
MTIRTFWTIFLKILGIWLVLRILTIFSQFLSAFSFFGNNQQENIFAGLLILGLLVLTIAAYIFVLWLFVFKSEWIINKLRLDKGFQEEKLELNIHLKTVLAISTIVIGGLTFIDGLPQLCKEIFLSFQNQNVLRKDPTLSWIVFYSIKTLIGYLLMTNSSLVVGFLEKQKQVSEEEIK